MKKINKSQAGRLKFAATTLVVLSGIAQGQYATSQNGLVRAFEIDSFVNSAGNPTQIFDYTGSFFNGNTWSLHGSDLNSTDGLESAMQNPYNARYDSGGSRTDLVASGQAPWGNQGQFLNSTSGTDWETVRSYYQNFGSFQLSGGGYSDMLGSGAQTYLSPTGYTFTFDQAQKDVYLYLQDVDDAMLYGFNYTPTVVTSPTDYFSDYSGDNSALGALYYDEAAGVLMDADGKGEGMGLGTTGLPWQIFPGSQSGWNPSTGGVVKFSDPNGISSLSFNVALLDAAHDGNIYEQSDGFAMALAIPVPEPSSALLLGLFGIKAVLRRRRA